MLTSLIRKEIDNDKSNELETNYYSNIFFDAVEKLFWETDLFIRFNARNYIGVFPFCSKNNSIVIKNKMIEEFNQLLDQNIIPNGFSLLVVFSSCPDEAKDIDSFKKNLISKAKKQNSDIKISW
jgi:adenylate cyclase class IV